MTKQRTFPPVIWLLLAAVLLAIIYGLVLFVFALRYPSDGAGGHFGSAGFTIDVAPAVSTLNDGDIVVGIHDRSIDDGLFTLGLWHNFLFDGMPSEATYVIRRAGQQMTVQVPWQPWQPLAFVLRVAPFSIVAFSFFAALFLVLLSRSYDTVTLLVLLEFCVQGINLINNMVTSIGANLAVSLAWFFAPLDVMTFSVGIALFFHVLLVFPEKKQLIIQFPRGIYLVYVVNVVIGLAVIFWRGSGNTLQNRAFIFGNILYPVAAVELVVGLAHLVHTYLTSRRPGVRNQIRWLMWGTVLGTLPWLLLYNVPSALTGKPLVPLGIASLPLVLVTIAFFFSVTRRGLIVVDTLINRSVVYAGVTVLLTGMYLLVVSALRPVTAIVVGKSDTWLTSVIAIVLVALVATPLRARLQVWVDRAFYRRWHDLKSLLREVGQRLSMTLRLETLVPILVDEIPQQLHITQAALLLRDADAVLRAADASGLLFAPDHPLIIRLGSADIPLVLSQTKRADSDLADFDGRRWEIALPLRSGGQLSGVYLLGPRLSGDLFSQGEIETLILLGQQIAVAIENARLYRQVEQYSQRLESQVVERTRELELTNQELGKERDRLGVIIQNMADGLLVVSPTGQIILVNPAFEAMIRQVSVVGRMVGEVLECPHMVAIVERAGMEPGVVLSADCTLDDRVLRASSVALRDGSGTITVVRDVTHEVAVDRMKTEFISSVSHELRTPLTSVMGFTKLIHKSLGRDVVPAVAEDRKAQRAVQRALDNLNIITVESERLARLVNDVLDIAKIESGKIEWNDATFDLGTIVQQAIDDVTVVAWQKGIKLHVNLGSCVPSLVADPERMRQVLFNLLSNAVKFTDEGNITVETRFVEAGEMTERWAYPGSEYTGVLVSVKDTGLGIPKEEIPYLFQQFKQIWEDALISKPQGTGLGLAISRGIITHYGGQIWVESEIGEGSNFQFVLPIIAPGTKVAVSTPPAMMPGISRRMQQDLASAMGKAPTVLIVDDEPNVRELLVQELTAGGYRVLEASNGIDALATARRYRPSAIVLDLMMPGLSGFDVIQLLKSDVTTAAIPIVILSIIDDKEKGFIMGADAYLTKPIGMDVLLDALADLISPASEMSRTVMTGTDRSAMEQVTRALREDGFQVVDAYDSRGTLEGLPFTAPDMKVIDRMLVELDDAEAIKAFRFQQKLQDCTIVVIVGFGHDTAPGQ